MKKFTNLNVCIKETSFLAVAPALSALDDPPGPCWPNLFWPGGLLANLVWLGSLILLLACLLLELPFSWLFGNPLWGGLLISSDLLVVKVLFDPKPPPLLKDVPPPPRALCPGPPLEKPPRPNDDLAVVCGAQAGSSACDCLPAGGNNGLLELALSGGVGGTKPGGWKAWKAV